MALADDKVQLTTVIERNLDTKISELGDRMGISKSAMAAMLLDAAVEDNETMIKIVTSRFAKRLVAAVGPKPKRVGKVKEVEGD